MAKAATAKAPKAPSGPSLSMPELTAGSQKAALAAAEATSGKGLVMMAPDRLRVIPGFNVRVHDTDEYQSEIQNLKQSIMAEGFYSTKPLAGYVGKDGDADVIYVTDGHRRLEALTAAIADGAEITSVPVILKEGKTDMVSLTVALLKENTGKPLTMLETSIIVKRLLKHGLSEDLIAERLGMTKRMVQDYLILIAAPKSIRNFVRANKISGTEAVRILRAEVDPKNPKDTKKAEDRIAAAVAKAEARGKPKATRADDEEAAPRAPRAGSAARKQADAGEGGDGDGEDAGEQGPGVRMSSIETRWAAKAGHEFDLSEIRSFKNLFGDTDWYSVLTDRPGKAVATEDVNFRAIVSRPKRDVADQTAADGGDEGEGEGEEAEGEGEGEGEETEAEVQPEPEAAKKGRGKRSAAAQAALEAPDDDEAADL